VAGQGWSDGKVMLELSFSLFQFLTSYKLHSSLHWQPRLANGNGARPKLIAIQALREVKDVGYIE